jgi:hypothetical protein
MPSNQRVNVRPHRNTQLAIRRMLSRFAIFDNIKCRRLIAHRR